MGMKRLAVLMVVLALSMPMAAARKRAAAPADGGASATTAAPAAAAASGRQDAPTAESGGDITKTLDDVLSKPIDTLVREAPKPQVENYMAPPPESQPPAMVPTNSPVMTPDDYSVPGLKALTPKQAPQVLRGNASIGAMRGTAEDGGPLNGAANNGGPLRGAATQADPDAGDQQLAVEWDRWRNRFLRAVQLQVQASVNNPDEDDFGRRRFDRFTGMPMPRFPLGTETWFDCEVDRDRRIVRVAITQPSGYPAYDRAVLEGIRALEGTTLLVFPRGSHRLSVRQEAGIRTATSSNFQYYNFGDVERYSQPRRNGGY